MKNKKELSTEEALAKLYVSTLEHVHDSTLLTIKFYENKCNILRNEIIILEENEPFKIFKKSYQKWQEKLKKLKIDYDKATSDLMNEYKELSDIINLYNN